MDVGNLVQVELRGPAGRTDRLLVLLGNLVERWPDFIAFRFEPPEQGDNHNYYHSQPCRNMGWEGTPDYGAMRVPERNPTWPLAAKSSLDLLLCLVIAIGGMRGLAQVQSRIDSNGAMRQNTLLTQALRGMMALRHG